MQRSRRLPARPLRPLVVLSALAIAVAGTGGPAGAQTAKAPAPATAPAVPPAKPVAPVSTDPASTSASYGDWVLRCQRIGEGDKAQRLCEVAQVIQVQNQRDPIAEIALGHLPNDPTLRLTAALPPSVSFPSTVEIAPAPPAGPAVQLQWRRCVAGGCFADAQPSDDTVKAWRGLQAAGRLTFRDAGGRDIALPISFRGLAQALDALPRT